MGDDAMFRSGSYYRALSCWQVGLTILDALTIRLSVNGVSSWPPFVYPELSVSVRWGSERCLMQDEDGNLGPRRCRRVWRHYGVTASDLGTVALSFHARRVYVSLLVVTVWADAPVRDRTVFRFSLFRTVQSRWRVRRGLAPVTRP